jgi:raffinose/stachyose/melibiose transport system substrate-binding protein
VGPTRSSAAEEAAWNRVFADFEKQYKCTVKATWQGDFTTVPNTLRAAKLAKQNIDLVEVATTTFDLARGGMLMDLTDLSHKLDGRFSPPSLNDYTLGGHVFALPLSGQSASVIFYNADIFKKLEIPVPITYAQFVSAGKKISASGVTPLVQGGKDTWTWPMWYMSTFSQVTNNKSLDLIRSILDGKTKFTDANSVAALKYIAQFAKDELLTSDALATEETAAVATFVQGKAAMMFDGTWALSSIRAAKPAFTVGIARFPIVTGSTKVKSQPNGAAEGGWAIPTISNVKNRAKAAQFIEFATRKINASKILTGQGIVVPSVLNATVGSSEPLAKVLATSFAPDTIQWLDWLWPNDINDAIIQATESVLYKNMDPAVAAAGIQKVYDSLVKTQKYHYSWWNNWTSSDWSKIKFTTGSTLEVKE